MAVISTRSRSRVQQLKSTENQPRNAAPKRIRKRAVAILAGRTKKGVVGTKEIHSDKQIEHREKYGSLTVDKTRMIRSKKQREYYTVCDCGSGQYLTAIQILERAKLLSGCMGFTCEYSRTGVKLWHNPEFALWFQLQQLRAKYPTDLEPSWGGSAYEGLPPADDSEAFSNMLEFAKEGKDLAEGRYWLHKLNKHLPYADYNVVFKATPNKALFSQNTLYVMYDGFPLPLPELADSFGIPQERAMALRGTIMTDAEFIDALIEESIHVED